MMIVLENSRCYRIPKDLIKNLVEKENDPAKGVARDALRRGFVFMVE